MNIRLAQRELKTKFGNFTEILYYDGQVESTAIVMGDVLNAENVLCRIHSSCITAHVFNSIECDCREQMELSQALIEKEGAGIVILLNQEGKGNGHFALMQSIPFKEAGHSQGDAYKMAGFKADARSFRPAAEILIELNIKSVILLTNNPEKAADLRQYHVTVSDIKDLTL